MERGAAPTYAMRDDSFFGGEFRREFYELLAISHIPLQALRREAELFGKKWFDYRPWHPTKATYYLAQCYSRAYGKFLSQAKDLGMMWSKGFKGKDFIDSREKTAFWTLRQKCDEAGVRYDFAMRYAMEWCLRRGWKQPPRPAHIYSDADLWIDLLDAWAMEQRGKFQFATHPRYRVENYVGAPDQQEYEDRVIKMVKRSPVREFALHTAMYLRGAVRIERAIREFGQAIVFGAIQCAS